MLWIKLAQRIYLFAFKLDGSAEVALAQIKTHQYATKYRGYAKPVHLVGVNFVAETGEVREWLEEIDGQRRPGTDIR